MEGFQTWHNMFEAFYNAIPEDLRNAGLEERRPNQKALYASLSQIKRKWSPWLSDVEKSRLITLLIDTNWDSPFNLVDDALQQMISFIQYCAGSSTTLKHAIKEDLKKNPKKKEADALVAQADTGKKKKKKKGEPAAKATPTAGAPPKPGAAAPKAAAKTAAGKPKGNPNFGRAKQAFMLQNPEALAKDVTEAFFGKSVDAWAEAHAAIVATRRSEKGKPPPVPKAGAPPKAGSPAAGRKAFPDVCLRWLHLEQFKDKQRCDDPKCKKVHGDQPLCAAFRNHNCTREASCRMAHEYHRKVLQKSPSGKHLLIDYSPKPETTCRKCKTMWKDHSKIGWCAGEAP
jgi:hypothetical protein